MSAFSDFDIRNYRKAIVAIGGFCAALGIVLQDGVVTDDEKIALIAAALTAVGVWAAPNRPKAPVEEPAAPVEE